MLDIVLGERASSLDVPYLLVEGLTKKNMELPILPLDQLVGYIKEWKGQVVMN